MRTLMRIDKGYTILQRVKEHYEEEKILPELEELKEKVQDLEEFEKRIRLEIDCLRNELKSQEVSLVEADREIVTVVENIYQCSDFIDKNKLRLREEELKQSKVNIKTMMVEKFTMIDIKLEELKNLKNRKQILMLEMRPYIKLIGTKEQKIMEDIKKIEKKIRILRKGIDNDKLKAYDKKRVSMGKVFHPILDGKCSFCGETLVVTDVEDGILECPNCSRILFLEEDGE